MRHGLVAFSALLLVGLGLTGCGLFRFEQREPWRIQAEEACLSQRLVQPSAYMALSSKIEGPGACGVDYPFKVAAFGNGAVGLKSKVTLACPIIPRIDTWLDEIVRPAALLYFGVPIADMKAGSYSCRSRNHRVGAKLSEHSFGNALDVMGFVLADGREVSVLKGWRGRRDEQDFLREVFVGACRYFTTVLGPGSDAHHNDHLHIDLARHDPRGERRYCKPVLKFAPKIDPERDRELFQAQAPAFSRAPASAQVPPPASGPSTGAGYGADLRQAYAGDGQYAAMPPSLPPARPPAGLPEQTYAPPPALRAPVQSPAILGGHGLY